MKINIRQIPLFVIIVATLLAISIGTSLINISDIPMWLIIGISSLLALIIANFFYYLYNQIIYIDETADDISFASNKSNQQADFNIANFASKALDALQDPLIIIDDDARIISANQSARKRFSISKLDVRIESFIRLPQILNGIEAAQLKNQPQSLLLEQHFPNVKFEKVEISQFTHENKNFLMIHIGDETDIRKAERMRGDFLANAGHELRTPLASIIGFLETLQTSAKEDVKARNKFLEIMSKQADRMLRLINDILSLSKIELNEHILPKTKLNIVKSIEFACNAALPNLNKNNNKAIIDTYCKDCEIVGDNDEIQQVLANLLDNAIKYGLKDAPINIKIITDLNIEQASYSAAHGFIGSSSISLASPQKLNDVKYVLIRIENEGKGIAKKYLPRLSERFYRIDDESAAISGTGLGLAIVKHIISRHQGGLVVESSPNIKTAFSFFIPQGKI